VDAPVDPPGWQALASAASQPWVVAWPEGPVEPNLLLDLAAAAESSRADAVGQVGRPTSQFVTDLPFIGTLIRRDGLVAWPIREGSDGARSDLGAWARRGRRLFGSAIVTASVEP
jgi:hypothetical protein